MPQAAHHRSRIDGPCLRSIEAVPKTKNEGAMALNPKSQWFALKVGCGFVGFVLFFRHKFILLTLPQDFAVPVGAWSCSSTLVPLGPSDCVQSSMDVHPRLRLPVPLFHDPCNKNAGRTHRMKLMGCHRCHIGAKDIPTSLKTAG